MKLSPHFTLAELTKSQAAERQDIDNTPGINEINHLKHLCTHILEKVRDKYGPFSPSSGYRSLRLNRTIGSRDTSQHIEGKAADFELVGVSNYTLAAFIRDNLDFDQCILEFYLPGVPDSGWVHVSYNGEDNRNECLTINRDGVKEGLIE